MAVSRRIPKEKAWLKGTGGKLYGTKLAKRKYSDIDSVLGIQWSDLAPAADATTTDSMLDLRRNGVFRLILTYEVAGGSQQTTIVPCSNDNADTAIEALKGKKWNGQKIVLVKTA